MNASRASGFAGVTVGAGVVFFSECLARRFGLTLGFMLHFFRHRRRGGVARLRLFRPLQLRQLALDLPHLNANVVPRDHLLQRVHAVALRPALRHLIGGIAEMNPRLALDPLLLQTAMIDPRLVAVPFEMPVGEMRPLLAPLAQLLAPIHRRVFLGREAVPVQRPHRHHDVRVVVPVVARFVRRMNGDIDRVALPHERLAREILHQPFALLRRQFMRQGNLDLARQLRVLPLLRPLRMVPKLVAILRPVRRVFRRHDRRELDPLRPRLIEFLLVRLLVAQPLARPIRRRRDRALPFSPADNFRGQVKDGHARRLRLLSFRAGWRGLFSNPPRRFCASPCEARRWPVRERTCHEVTYKCALINSGSLASSYLSFLDSQVKIIIARITSTKLREKTMANDISGRIAQLKQKQEQLARRLNALEQKEKSQTRKLDTRRKIIVGGAVLGVIVESSRNRTLKPGTADYQRVA